MQNPSYHGPTFQKKSRLVKYHQNHLEWINLSKTGGGKALEFSTKSKDLV